MNNAADWQYHLIWYTVKALGRLSRSQINAAALMLGNLWFGLDRGHRRLAIDNIHRAYANRLSLPACRQLARRNFVHLMRVALEAPLLPHLNRQNIHQYVTLTGERYLRQALAGKRGVIVLTAHLGNWEMMAAAGPLLFDLPLDIVARRLDYQPLERVLMDIRTCTGNRMLDKIGGAAGIKSRLRQNRLVAIMLDQNASWYDGVYVPFFNRTACTNKGMALFAMRYRAAVLPVFNIRQPDGRYRICIDRPIEMLPAGGDLTRAMVHNTARFNRVIESYVRRAPDNWFWVHRRWNLKTIPEAARAKVAGLTMEN